MNDLLFLTPSYDFVEEPTDTVAEVRVNTYTYFGNDHTSFCPLDKHRNRLSFSGWILDEFFVNKQWNESFVTKLRVTKNGLPICDLTDAYRLLERVEKTKWLNAQYNGLRMYSAMFQNCIRFLNSIPEPLESSQSVYQYIKLYTSNSKSKLVEFYKFFIGAKSQLSEVEIKYIEELFLQKLSHILLA
ncbi:MAG: hypothetical protein HDS52_09295 [Barnesiella sp.]|nr:hypothetical protein [Barnesiella sp.]